MEKKLEGLANFNTEKETTEVIHLFYMIYLDGYFFKQGKHKELLKDYERAFREHYKVKTNYKGEVVKDKAYSVMKKVINGMQKDLEVMENRIGKVTELWNGQMEDNNPTYKVLARYYYDPLMSFSNLMMLLGPNDFWEFLKKKSNLSLEELFVEIRIAIQNLSNQNINNENRVLGHESKI